MTDPACDANQDVLISVADVQLTAGHWNQSGAFVSDNNHNHLGQTWVGSNNPLKMQGAFGSPDLAPLVLSNITGHGLHVGARQAMTACACTQRAGTACTCTRRAKTA